MNLSHLFCHFCFTKLPKVATICRMTVVAKNGNPPEFIKLLLPQTAIKGWIRYSIENLSPFFTISGNILYLNQ